MMINQIKEIVKNYINAQSLTVMQVGTVVSDGVKISDKLTIPLDFLVGNNVKNLDIGNKVRLLRNQGASEYYVLEVIEK